MKKGLVALIGVVLLIAVTVKNVNAVPGQLNYGIPITPQEPATTTVITDTKALDECNSKNKTLSRSEDLCRDNISQIEKENKNLKNQNTVYMALSFAGGIFSLAFGILFISAQLKKKNAGAPQQPPQLV